MVGVKTESDSLVMAASRVLVYGGKGALGASVVNIFREKSWVS